MTTDELARAKSEPRWAAGVGGWGWARGRREACGAVLSAESNAGGVFGCALCERGGEMSGASSVGG